MGTVMRALSALDIALWDLNARTAQLPLHKYLGAVELDTVPAYASGGYYVDGKTAGHVGEEMADRKSTRLNSSHLVISYAVFCLKKKTIHSLPHSDTVRVS